MTKNDLEVFLPDRPVANSLLTFLLWIEKRGTKLSLRTAPSRIHYLYGVYLEKQTDHFLVS